jgi:putative hydrolase of the HAD superfamily
MSESWNAVFWDLGGVILDPESIKRGRELFVAGLSVTFGLETTQAIEVWDTELGSYFRERDGQEFRPAHQGYEQTVAEVVGEPVSVDEWLPLAIQAVDVAFEPSDGAGQTLETLANAGYYLGVISDIDAWEAEFILTVLGVRDYFEHVTTSSEVGMTKPAPAMFERALEKAPVKPDAALFVGDRYENDMRGGTEAGFHTVAYGGTAAARATEDDPNVDLQIDDLREILELVGLESDG